MAKNGYIGVIPPDSGWAWIVLIASFCCCAVIRDIMDNISYIELFLNIPWSRLETLNACLMTAPIASALLNRFGFRLTAISGAILTAVFIGITYFAHNPSYSIIILVFLSGISLSMVYISAVTIVGFYFEKWRGLATGIAICGLEVGILVFPLLHQLITRRFSWHLILVFQGVTILACAIFALVFRPLKPTTVSASEVNEIEPTSETHDSALRKRLPGGRVAHIMPRYATTEHQYAHSQKGIHLLSERLRHPHSSILDLSLLVSPTFALLALSGSLYTMGLLAPSAYFLERATAHDMSYWAAATIASAIGGISLLGTFLCGIFATNPKVKALWINNVVITLAGVATLLSGIAVTVATQWTFAAFFGLSVGCFKGLRPIIVVELFGLEKLPDVYGLLLFFEGFTPVLFAFVTKLVYDLAGSYEVPFYVGGGLILFSAFLSYPASYVVNLERSRRERNTIRPV